MRDPADDRPASKGGETTRGGALRSLGHRDFKLFFASQTISATGTWIQKIALSWLVYRLTDSPAMLGLVNLAGGAAALPFALIGGAIADRWSRRSILGAVYIWMMLQAIALAVLVGTGAVQVWHLFVLEMLLGMGRAVEIPNRQALLMDTVGRSDLTSAVGLDKGVGNLTRLVGPSLAGVIVAVAGESVAFVINAASFAVALGLLLAMRPTPPASRDAKTRSTFRKGLGESARFLWRDGSLRGLLGLVGLSAFLALPYVILLPVFAKDILGASAAPVVAAICAGISPYASCSNPEAIPFGLLMGAVGLGGLAGSAFVAGSGEAHRGRRLAVATLVLPAGLLVFSQSTSFVLSLLALSVVGFAAAVQTAFAHVLFQLLVPDAMRGRVLGLYAVVFQGMIQLGGVQAGLGAEWLGAPFSLASGAAAALLFGALLVTRRDEIRRL